MDFKPDHTKSWTGKAE